MGQRDTSRRDFRVIALFWAIATIAILMVSAWMSVPNGLLPPSGGFVYIEVSCGVRHAIIAVLAIWAALAPRAWWIGFVAAMGGVIATALTVRMSCSFWAWFLYAYSAITLLFSRVRGAMPWLAEFLSVYLAVQIICIWLGWRVCADDTQTFRHAQKRRLRLLLTTAGVLTSMLVFFHISEAYFQLRNVPFLASASFFVFSTLLLVPVSTPLIWAIFRSRRSAASCLVVGFYVSSTSTWLMLTSDPSPFWSLETAVEAGEMLGGFWIFLLTGLLMLRRAGWHLKGYTREEFMESRSSG